MSDDEQLNQRAAVVEAEGVHRFGEKAWRNYLGAIGKVSGGQVSADELKTVIAQPNAADLMAQAGREALMRLASDGDDESSRVYRARSGRKSVRRIAK
jgi:hypothetical protein